MPFLQLDVFHFALKIITNKGERFVFLMEQLIRPSLILTSILASQIVGYRGGKTIQIWTPGMLDL